MLIDNGDGSTAAPARREGLLDPRLIFRGLPGRSREEVLAELSQRVCAEGLIPDGEELTTRLLAREKLGCTGLGGGIAIPHCKLPDLDEVVVAVASTQAPVDFGASDGNPVELIFLVVSPTQAAAAHLQALARVSRLLRAPGVVAGLREAGSQERFLEVLREAEAGLPVTQ
jgi:PTS system nitrogen regulatory IIA component